MQVASIHIVRRYGPVGGMENYVYQLTHALVQQGQSVTILCENNEAKEYDKRLKIVELGNPYRKPRWRAQWGFSQQVAVYMEHNPSTSAIIHSHERTSVHHVTTFHGPPFAMRKHRLFDGLSPRIRMWTKLEEQELLGEQVRLILPNSPLIGQQLKRFYPQIEAKLGPPAYPGVSPHFSAIKRCSSGATVGFLGKEWKRKGLDIACHIVDRLREQIPDIHFIVAGCDPDDIQPLFSGWPMGSYTLMGWVEPEYFLDKIDVLLHPARAEPFGMVIAEANAAGVPVVVSDQCGAAALIEQEQGQVCTLRADQSDITEWVIACRKQLGRESVSRLDLSWDSLAEQHIEHYRRIVKELGSVAL